MHCILMGRTKANNSSNEVVNTNKEKQSNRSNKIDGYLPENETVFVANFQLNYIKFVRLSI